MAKGARKKYNPPGLQYLPGVSKEMHRFFSRMWYVAKGQGDPVPTKTLFLHRILMEWGQEKLGVSPDPHG